MKKNDKVLIFDTTLRDGEQAPGATMNQAEKLEIAFALERLGVDIIEAGFAISSKGDFDSVQNIAKHIKKSTVCSLARSLPKDIDAAADAIKPAKNGRIHIFLATSKIHLEHKFKKSQDQILDMAISAVKYARKRCDNLEFSPEDASRTEKEFLYRVLEAVIKAGATTVNIPDTVGYSTPAEYGAVIAGIMNHVPNINKAIISTHCHDDLGLAVANSLAGVVNGARQVECTINGIGERAGNASMEEIVMAIRTRKDFYSLDTNINAKEFYRISRMVSKATGFIVPPNKAIVGANAFRHESGIHQDGVLKEKRTYEIMDAESVGVPPNEGLVLGKHSGRHAFTNRLKVLNIHLSDADTDKAFARFKDLADKKKEIYDEDLIAIAEDEGHLVAEIYTLMDYHVTSGTKVAPEVNITLKYKGKKIVKKSTGDGPVDACYKAIEKATSLKIQLMDYGIQSVSQGEDALGEVKVKAVVEGKTVMGRGASTDIIEASAKAYVNAVNNYLAQSQK
ncbi:MAG: 2-isopropylmalate synthase [Candidatus Omnitrophica bacterium]|nr:2-isopropylmalate synthase [Candidatus Omnitrophota bacterium]